VCVKAGRDMGQLSAKNLPRGPQQALRDRPPWADTSERNHIVKTNRNNTLTRRAQASAR
jgi:hypothetical protein